MERLWTALAAYVALAALITITPGVDNFLILRYATVSGWRAALSAGLGISLGCFVWAAASILGLTALLVASGFAFTLLRAVGAAYLAWLGIMALWRERRASGADGTYSSAAHASRSAPVNHAAAFRVGMATNLLNAKAGLFFLSVLPQFLPTGYPTLPTAALFVVVHLSVGMLWFILISTVVERARALLSRPVVRRRLEQATGVVFLALAIRLAVAGP